MQLKQLRLIWFDPLLGEGEGSQADNFAQSVRHHLDDYGLVFLPCVNTDEVYQQAMASVSARADHGVPALVLLNADFMQNCAVSHYLRAAAPGVCIILRTPDYKEQTLMRALQSGADGYFSGRVSAHFLSSLVFSRMRSGANYLPAAAQSNVSALPEHGWCFAEQAWVMVSPDGLRVRLTSSERALFLALTNQPQMCASHNILIEHLWSGSHKAEENGRERMSVMVNRLRQKFKAKGLELPIRTLHGKGYMFYGPFIQSRNK